MGRRRRSLIGTAVVLAALAIAGWRWAPAPTVNDPCPSSRWVLVYSGGPHRPAYPVRDLVRYVAEVDTLGTPVAWLTTGAVVLEIQAPSGRWLTGVPATRGAAALGEDWSAFLDSTFAEGGVLARLDSAVGEAEATLGERHRPFDVAVTIPYPNPRSGVVTFADSTFDLGTAPGRIALVAAYIHEAERRFRLRPRPHLDLAGFYWLMEMVPAADTLVVRSAADELHRAGLRLYWAPDNRDQGVFIWRRLGIDQVWMQPNYYLGPEFGLGRMDSALVFVRQRGMGMVVEFDRRLFNEPARFGGRLDPYLAALDTSPDLRAGSLALYEGGGGLLPLSAGRDPATRALYQRLARVFGVPAGAPECH